MKKIFLIAASLFTFVGCFDDSALWESINDHESRISELERLCAEMNTNITSLQSLVSALERNDYITNVTPIEKNGDVIGYTISFAKADPVTIYHGVDGQTPVIGVLQDIDGVYYWTLNGVWLLDASGNKIPTTGKDGADGKDGIDGEDGKDGADGSDGAPGADGANGSDGQDGAPGQDGITPQLKIEDGYWYVSYDNGASWVEVGKATGEQGPQGDQGPQGTSGNDGDPMFADIDYSTSNEYVTFILSNGTQIQIPTWYAFETLRAQCERMNSNIEALQSIVSALEDNDYVTDVIPVVENGKEVGYIIKFSKSGSVTIYHGQDGTDGVDGQAPVIGIRQDTDGGYYWTLNGEWLLDASGNKIPTTGKDGADGKDGIDGEDGKDGADGSDGSNGAPGADGANGSDGQDGAPGQDGEDGITPQLKIEDGYWYVSYDDGASWVVVGQATGDQGSQGEQGPQGTPGKDGDSFFQSVTQDDEFVHFTLADGTVISIPKRISLAIEFDSEDLVVMQTNSSRDIRYTVTSILPDVEVEVISSADIKTKVISDDSYSGVIRVKTGDAIDEYSKVVVLVSNGDKVIMKTLEFEESAIEVIDEARVIGSAEGGVVELIYLSNLECEVVIPDDAKDWISLAPETKALQQRSVSLVLQPNTEYYRSSTVTIKAIDGSLALEYIIEQDGDFGVNIDPTQIPDNEIWYTTTDGKIYNIHYCTETFGSSYKPFDADVVSNTYIDGIGVIKCNAPITRINWCAIRGYDVTTNNITQLFLPDCIEIISDAAIEGTELTTLHIPANLKQYGGNSNLKIDKFSGKYVSEDGRCIIIDNTLCGFAPKGVVDYSIPEGVKQISSGAFRECSELESIVLNEGIEVIGYAAFVYCSNLQSITFPSTLQTIEGEAFGHCYSIKGFYGNENFHTSDNRCLIRSAEIPGDLNTYGKWIQRFAGNGLNEYVIPEGIIGIERGAFSYCSDLKILTIPNSLVEISSGAFGENLGDMAGIVSVYGEHTSDDNKCFVIDDELKYFVAKKGVVKYIIPDNITSIASLAFANNYELQELYMGDNVRTIGGGCFARCPQLKSVQLSASLKEIKGSDPFDLCENLQKVYLRSLVPPLYCDEYDNFTNFKLFVPQQSIELYKNNIGWSQHRDCFVGYDYNDLPTFDYYVSSDFSKNGEVRTLQKATIGDGIDIILLGDAYSDRQIADGTYHDDMNKMCEHFFSEEPFKSFRDYFNVYYVNIVSCTEGYDNPGAALMGYYDGAWSAVETVCFNYAQRVVGEDRMNECTIIIGLNSDIYTGECYFYRPDYNSDYGSGITITLFSNGGEEETAKQLLHHEACGHGFAKLSDEYVVLEQSIPGDHVYYHQQDQINYGWWKNVDFTDDPTQILWKHFLSDERYADNVGIYEGGNCYGMGVWRSSPYSIMRYNTGGFNAPSREAIWYRIHKLAYGDSWEYDYEEFVEWDAINRASSASAPQKARKNYVEKPFEPTSPPVVVGKSWRDVLD